LELFKNIAYIKDPSSMQKELNELRKKDMLRNPHKYKKSDIQLLFQKSNK